MSVFMTPASHRSRLVTSPGHRASTVDEDGSAADPAVAEVIDGVVGGFQRMAAGMERHLALVREGRQVKLNGSLQLDRPEDADTPLPDPSIRLV